MIETLITVESETIYFTNEIPASWDKRLFDFFAIGDRKIAVLKRLHFDAYNLNLLLAYGYVDWSLVNLNRKYASALKVTERGQKAINGWQNRNRERYAKFWTERGLTVESK